MRRFMLGGLFLAALSLALGTATRVEAVPTDLSTGVNLVGNIDQIWTVSYTYNAIAYTDQKTTLGAITPGSTALGAWIPNDPGNSQWIMPVTSGDGKAVFTDNNAPPKAGEAVLELDYKTTFTLTSDQLLDARLVGKITASARWTSDNNAVQILLNGTALATAGPLASDPQPFHQLYDVTGTGAGLFGTTNTLEIIVKNQPQDSGNPTGVRFEGQVVVPEPSTLAIAGLGALGFGAHAWRRRKAKKS